MSKVRRGKIARLPASLREEVNRRLFDGEEGRHCLAWLNALPEVQAVLAAQFGARPINDQNLTEWRHGGYREWLDEREARVVAERLGLEAITSEGQEPLTETLASWVISRYVLATSRVAGGRGKEGWRLLREMTHDVVALRRGDHRARHMEVIRQRLAQNLGLQISLRFPRRFRSKPKCSAENPAPPAAGEESVQTPAPPPSEGFKHIQP